LEAKGNTLALQEKACLTDVPKSLPFFNTGNKKGRSEPERPDCLNARIMQHSLV